MVSMKPHKGGFHTDDAASKFSRDGRNGLDHFLDALHWAPSSI